MIKNTYLYDDIIQLPHHVSTKRKHMSMADRAAQFAPFAALTGFEEEVKETARLVDHEILLDDESKEKLNEKIRIISFFVKDHPLIIVTYFIDDLKKDGGRYEAYSGNVRRIDETNHQIIFMDKMKIDIYKIFDIRSNLFQDML